MPVQMPTHMPAQLLIINPNTSASVGATLMQLALREAAGLCQVRVQTARLGASYISDEVSFAIAGHALLDAYAFDKAQPGQQPPDAVLIACFGDPGLLALRQLSHAPVLGLAQASMQAAHEAVSPHARYAVITGGQAWVPMLQRLAAQLGLDDRLAAVEAVEKTGAQLAANPEAAVRELADLCEQLLAKDASLQTILLGGAALGGLAQPIQSLLRQRGLTEVKLMDSVTVSLKASMAQAHVFAAQRVVGSQAAPSVSHTPVSTSNLSPELQSLLVSPRAW
jgi:allantoin racemase